MEESGARLHGNALRESHAQAATAITAGGL